MRKENNQNKLENILQMDGYRIVKNVYQREKRGGKPLILIHEDKFYVTELSSNIITVPTNLEVTWALITPKVSVENSQIKRIVVVSLYYTEKTKKSDFIDHLSYSYHHLWRTSGVDYQ